VTKAKTLDMTTGPFLKKILLFAVPIIISGLLQLLFNAADTVIVGKFSADGDFAVSAVGSTASLINALVALAMGLGNGSGVVVAQNVGAKNSEAVKKTVHTSMLLSVILGVAIGAVGFFCASPLLRLMNAPDEVIGLAALYVKIYFLGLPVQLIYNFGSAILRSIGDTTRPLIFLGIAGVLNVGLNILFVVGFNMSVAGVALATVISQTVSAALVVIYMKKQNNDCRLYIKDLKIHTKSLTQTLYIGIPAGLQGMIFSVSNTILQATINTFGPLAMAGSAAATSVANFIFIPMNSIHHASTSFIGQNTGAKKIEQIKKLIFMLNGIAMAMGVVLTIPIVIYGKFFLGIFTSTEEAIIYGYTHLVVLCVPYFICGAMDVTVGCIRGMGTSLAPMLVSIFGVCGFRFLWIWVIFPFIKGMVENSYQQYFFLFLSYFISWAITLTLQVIICIKTYKKLKLKYT